MINDDKNEIFEYLWAKHFSEGLGAVGDFIYAIILTGMSLGFFWVAFIFARAIFFDL